MQIVSIGSHPDDVEMGMGGTIAKHNDIGDDVKIILCTLGGATGHHKERKEEALKSARLLGASMLSILDYPVSKLNKPTPEFINIIKKLIDEFNPDRVYTHSPFDYHQVHVGVSTSVTQAAKNVKQILFYETISSTSHNFEPNAFVDITNYIDLKIKSLQVHRTQSGRFYIKPGITRSLANTRYVWGKVGSDPNGLAEAFRIGKFII